MRVLYLTVCICLIGVSYSRERRRHDGSRYHRNRIPVHNARPQQPMFHAPPQRPGYRPPLTSPVACARRTVQAVCRMITNPSIGNDFTVSGTVHMTQTLGCMSQERVSFSLDLNGFPTGNDSMHGFHVHEFGDFTSGCATFGGHYNPDGNIHGSPQDPIGRRHLGDLGNIIKNFDGTILAKFTAPEGISLVGPKSIIRRGLVIHMNPDDLGRGGNSGSTATGNAGMRYACCEIVRSANGAGHNRGI